MIRFILIYLKNQILYHIIVIIKEILTKEINFNTQSLASQIINYKDAYVLLEIQVAVLYENGDLEKKQFLNYYI